MFCKRNHLNKGYFRNKTIASFVKLHMPSFSRLAKYFCTHPYSLYIISGFEEEEGDDPRGSRLWKPLGTLSLAPKPCMCNKLVA